MSKINDETTHCRARVLSAVAENLHQKIGSTVDHPRLCGKGRIGVDHPEYFYNALHPVEVAKLRLYRREHADGSELRCLVTLLQLNCPGPEPSLPITNFPSGIHHLSHGDSRHEIANSFGTRRIIPNA